MDHPGARDGGNLGLEVRSESVSLVSRYRGEWPEAVRGRRTWPVSIPDGEGLLPMC
jgi:hypothetical protein